MGRGEGGKETERERRVGEERAELEVRGLAAEEGIELERREAERGLGKEGRLE